MKPEPTKRSHAQSGRVHPLMLVVVVLIAGLVAAWVGFIVLSDGDGHQVSRSADDVEPTPQQADEQEDEPTKQSEAEQADRKPEDPAESPPAPTLSRPIEELRAEAQQAVADTRKLATDLEHPALQRLYGGLQVDLDDAQSFEESGDTLRAGQTYESIVERAKRLADSKAKLPELKTASVAYTEALRETNSLKGPEYERESFLKASKEAEQAADAVDQGDFAAAVESYNAGAQTLQSIIAAQRERITAARAEGEKALEEGDGDAATAAFTRLLEIDKDDEQARINLDRALTIEELVELLNKAQAFEDQQVYDLAQVELNKAIELDPHSTEAKTALERIVKLIAEKAFNDALLAAETAYGKKRYADATQASKDALALKPEHAGAKGLLERSEAALIEQKVAVFVYDAVQAERKHDYQKAFDLYKEALLIQPGRAEAVEGRDRAAQGIKNQNTADELIKRAEDRLAKPSVEEIDRAKAELNKAAELVPYDKRPPDLLAKAETLLAELTKPVKVTIKSDGKTNIIFYKVGRYEPLTSRTIEVKPGTYTIKGWRKGYQDEFVEITVHPGKSPEPVTVIVSKKI